MSKTAALQAVDGVFAEIGEALAGGNEVRILGFGSFVTRNRPARTARNPGTGERVEIAASTVPAFKPGKPLKDAVNGKSAS
ncbi:MAG: HU family DNA-binding protein [Alphaproteobacteria bacterium]|nr:HU family DNA-binding protein [Alphaproteobacteria bacterium]